MFAEAFYRPHGGRDRIVITFDNDAATIERHRTRKSSCGPRRLGASELRAAIEAWLPWTWEPPASLQRRAPTATFVFAKEGVVREVRCQGAAPAEVGTRLEQLTRLPPHVLSGASSKRAWLGEARWPVRRRKTASR